MSRVYVPGAKLELDDFGFPRLDDKRRPIWNMPKPLETVRHFKSAAKRLAYEQGRMSHAEATKEVPIYRGFPIALFKYLMRGYQRTQRGRWAQ